jgi:hypothetical protein
MKKIPFFCLLGLLCAASPGGLFADPAPLVADAYTSSSQPKRNFGTSGQLLIGSHEKTFLRFDLSALGSGLTGGNIAKATLKLYVRKVSGAGTVTVSPVTSVWNERTIDFASNPTIGTAETNFAVSADNLNSFVSIDLTDLARRWIDTPSTNNGIVLTASTGLQATLDSKENVATAHEAVLEIQLSSGSSAATAFALYYAKISQILDAATAGSPPTYGLVEFEQNPPNGSDPSHANVSVGGFTTSADDATFPTSITSITVPVSGYYRITVKLSTAGATQIALVKNIGSVTAGSFPFNGTVSSFTAINAGISAIAITTTPYQVSNQTITQLAAGDNLAVINANTAGPLALNSATTGIGSSPSGDSVSASVEIQYLGPIVP